MAKLDRLVIILNMLHHRSSLSLHTIMEVCEVTERTAYRYIAALSRANIPVYYDKAVGGYRLSKTSNVDFAKLTVGEACLAIAALELLATKVNTAYQVDLERAIQKVISAREFPLEEFREYFRKVCDTDDAELSDTLTNVLVNLAVRFNRKVNLVTGENGTYRLTEPIVPRLRFRDRWEIVSPELAGQDEAGIPLGEIENVSML